MIITTIFFSLSECVKYTVRYQRPNSLELKVTFCYTKNYLLQQTVFQMRISTSGKCPFLSYWIKRGITFVG